jgi:arylsulfatase A-like enzyme
MVSAREPEKSLWSRSCIHGGWKLISWRKDPPQVKPPLNGNRRKHEGAFLELFDVSKDPNEQTNLAQQQPDKVRELLSHMNKWWNPDNEQ